MAVPSAVAAGALLALAVLFRLPAFINANGVNSDMAIAGLQARHVLAGEWSWHLWGTGYQGSADLLLLALEFAVAGATPLALAISTALPQLLRMVIAFDVLRRRLSIGRSALAVSVLAVAPPVFTGVHSREWGVTLIFGAIWLLDGAAEARGWRLRTFAGTLLGLVSLYFDLFSLQMVPGLMAFALLCALDDGPSLASVLQRMGVGLAGAAVGAAGVGALARFAGGNVATAGFSWSRLAHNFELLWQQCLPFALSYGVYVPGPTLTPDRAHPAALFQAVEVLGAVLLMAGIILAAAALFVRRLPWKVRRLGVLGFLVALSSLVGFLVSAMPSDLWAARYLAPVVLVAPFALAPAAALLGTAGFGLGLAPYLVSALVGGWMTYGPYVRGPLPVKDPRGQANEEADVAAALRERGVRYAAAQYWLSYRLTFLFGEDPIVVPLPPEGDRYFPYQRGFQQAPVVAYLFHPSEPRARPEPFEQWLRQTGQSYERLQVHGFTLLVHRRAR